MSKRAFLIVFINFVFILAGIVAFGSNQRDYSSESQGDLSNYTGGYYSIDGNMKDTDIADIERSVSSVAGLSEPTIKPRTSTETILCLGILAFGLVLVIFSGYIAIRKGSGWDNDATRIFTVSLIVTAGLFLITAGYSDSQIAPMYGLLGTIVGYVLGKAPPSG